MRFKKSTETVVHVPLSGGCLIGKQEIKRCNDAYGVLPEVERRFVCYQPKKRREQSFSTLEDLQAATTEIDFQKEMPARPQKWAELLAFLLDAGRVLHPDSRLDFLTEYGLDLRNLAPRTKEKELIFYTVQFGLERKTRPINRVLTNLATLESSVEKMGNIEDLKSGKPWTVVA